MLLMIDNYDSFTYNIVQYLRELGVEVILVRNDEITPSGIDTIRPDKIVLSPGPGTPEDAGISLEVVKKYSSSIPILGVCLGHQCLAQAYGGKVVQAGSVMHGKTSKVHHDSMGLFQQINSPFLATRYHSLVVDEQTLPSELEITAWTEKEPGKADEIMGLRHRKNPSYGVQFHPESILSESGHQLLKNFVDL